MEYFSEEFQWNGKFTFSLITNTASKVGIVIVIVAKFQFSTKVMIMSLFIKLLLSFDENLHVIINSLNKRSKIFLHMYQIQN